MKKSIVGDLNVYKFVIFERHPKVSALITTRDGGFSVLPSRIGDRDRLASSLGVTRDKLIFLSQIHSDTIIKIDSPKQVPPDGDGAVTKKMGFFLCGQSADCPIVLLFDPVGKCCAMAHSGWRGTAKNITAKVVKSMVSDFGSNPLDILAAVSPAIGRCCYEVGHEVADAIRPSSEGVEAFLSPSKGGKYMLDLKGVILGQLIGEGVLREKIEVSEFCTRCNNDIFYSYRAEGTNSGRFAACIGMLGGTD